MKFEISDKWILTPPVCPTLVRYKCWKCIINVVLLSIINQHKGKVATRSGSGTIGKMLGCLYGLDYKNQIEQHSGVSNQGLHPQITRYYLPIKSVNILTSQPRDISASCNLLFVFTKFHSSIMLILFCLTHSRGWLHTKWTNLRRYPKHV